MPAGRPPSIHSRFFYRELSMEDKIILSAAGKGNITHGFKHLIECYQVLWQRGYRPHKDLDKFLNKQTISEDSDG
jgi:hypothetical protein